MQNLIYLIIMLLAGGAGWMAGSWSGKDAKEALARVEQTSLQAKAALDQSEATLKAELAAQKLKFDAERQKLDDEHNRQTTDFKAIIATTSTRIAQLDKSSAAKQAEIARLGKLRDAAATPEEKKKLDDAIKVVVDEKKAVDTEKDGRQCLAVAVPTDLLAVWRGSPP